MRGRRLASSPLANRGRDDRPALARLLAAALILVCLTALLAPPGAAFAADIESISYDAPDGWRVIEDGPDPVWIQYSASDENVFGWTAYGEVYIMAVRPGELPNVHLFPTGDLLFTSYDDFAARSAVVWYNTQEQSSPSGESWVGARQTTIGGFDALITGTKSGALRGITGAVSLITALVQVVSLGGILVGGLADGAPLLSLLPMAIATGSALIMALKTASVALRRRS